MSDIIEEMKIYPAPHLIALDNNANISFSVSGSKTQSATVGLMEIIDTYYQKYLVGHPISDSEQCSIDIVDTTHCSDLLCTNYYVRVGLGGALVETTPFDRMVVDSNPALAAMYGHWASPLLKVSCSASACKLRHSVN